MWFISRKGFFDSFGSCVDIGWVLPDISLEMGVFEINGGTFNFNNDTDFSLANEIVFYLLSDTLRS